MDLYSIINPNGLDGGSQPAQVHDNFIHETPDAPQPPRRSARPRAPRLATPSSVEGHSRPRKAGTLNGVRKRVGVPQGSGSGRGELVMREDSSRRTHPRSGRSTPTRPAARRAMAHAHAQAKEQIRRAAQAAAERSTAARGGRRVAIMDVILDAQAPTARLDLEDLMDAVEQAQRIALGQPGPEDNWLADQFVPGRFEARRAAVWRELLAAEEDAYASQQLYRVSAERSTACWDGELESDVESRSAWSVGHGSP